jgi:hypothetical protein
MFYPKLENRCLVCMKDEENEIEEALSNKQSPEILDALTEWLNEKSYCVEKVQLEKYLADRGIVMKIEEDDMGGGSPGPALTSLGDVNGMGNPTPPSNDGTNAGFYDVTKSGSGDRFTTLVAGTPAAKNKKYKNYKSLLSYVDFIKKRGK